MKIDVEVVCEVVEILWGKKIAQLPESKRGEFRAACKRKLLTACDKINYELEPMFNSMVKEV